MSTLTELRDVLIDYSQTRPRSTQTALGPSELGTPCQAQIARKLTHAPRRDVTTPLWAPLCGTAVHAEMEHVLTHWNTQLGYNRWLIEEALDIDGDIRGHGDAFDLDTATVVDWKYTGKTAINKLRAAQRRGETPGKQISQEYRIQAHLYGLGHTRAGRHVNIVSVVFLARDWQFDTSAEWEETYYPNVAFWALDRYYAIADTVTALDIPTHHDRITMIPTNPGEHCRWCPFHQAATPTSWASCAGDDAATARAATRFTDGLIT